MDGLITDGDSMTLDELAAAGENFSFLTLMGGDYSDSSSVIILEIIPRVKMILVIHRLDLYPVCIPPKVEFVGRSRKDPLGYFPLLPLMDQLCGCDTNRGYDGSPQVLQLLQDGSWWCFKYSNY